VLKILYASEEEKVVVAEQNGALQILNAEGEQIDQEMAG
jgi:hypothetical protein